MNAIWEEMTDFRAGYDFRAEFPTFFMSVKHSMDSFPEK